MCVSTLVCISVLLTLWYTVTIEPTTCSRSQSFGTFLGSISPDTQSYNADSTVSFTCNNDATLVGHKSIECLRNGSWSNVAPFCEPLNNNGVPCKHKGYKMYKNMCYGWYTSVSTQSKTSGFRKYEYANSLCKTRAPGSRLVTIRSPDTASNIANMLVQNGLPKFAFFTGLSNHNTDDLRWISGERFERVKGVSYPQMDSLVTAKYCVAIKSNVPWPGSSFLTFSMPNCETKLRTLCEILPVTYKDIVFISREYLQYSGRFEILNGVLFNGSPVYKHDSVDNLYLYKFVGILGEWLHTYWYIGDFSISNNARVSTLFYMNSDDPTNNDGTSEWRTFKDINTDIKTKQEVLSTLRWDKWKEWSACADGMQTRRRSCQDFQMEGKVECQGASVDERTCQEPEVWRYFGPCSKTCGSGTKFKACITGPCIGETRSESCWEQACPAIWDNWSPCSASCGAGTRERRCLSGSCLTSINKVESCINGECPMDSVSISTWGDWSPCSRTCGSGTTTRTRTCVSCKKEETKPCNNGDCFTINNGGSSGQSAKWSKCTKACGGGEQTCQLEPCSSVKRTCNPQTCRCIVPSIADVEITVFEFPTNPGSELTAGAVVKFKCNNAESTLIGESTMNCTTSGWNLNEYPSCGAPFACITPNVQNGKVFPVDQASFNPGEDITVTCDTGFESSGRSACGGNSDWSPEPKCFDKGCLFQEQRFTNANITYVTDLGNGHARKRGDQIKIKCNNDGITTTIQCLGKGIWNTDIESLYCMF